MQSSDPTEPPVRHDLAARRFEIVLDGYASELTYFVDGARLVFTHTFVPPELRGRGVAERLVRAGLAWARSEGRRVVPACSYVEKFIARHAEFQDLLAE
jgi:predicted GNAT family acetyltransferase